jgi:hypothetical protein
MPGHVGSTVVTDASPAAGSDDRPRPPVAESTTSPDTPAAVPEARQPVGIQRPRSASGREVPSIRSGLWVAAVTSIGFVGLGLAGARIWFDATDLPAYLVTRDGGSLDELQLGRSFNSPGWFLVVGLGLGLLGGLVFGAVFRRHGVVAVVAVFAGSLLASYVCYHYGVTLDQGPVEARLHAADPGDRVPVELSLRAVGVRLAWPIGALAGVLASQYALWRRNEESAVAPLRSLANPPEADG